MILSPRSGRQRHMIRLPPASRACSFCPIGSWGSASLHPRLYASTRCAGYQRREAPAGYADRFIFLVRLLNRGSSRSASMKGSTEIRPRLQLKPGSVLRLLRFQDLNGPGHPGAALRIANRKPDTSLQSRRIYQRRRIDRRRKRKRHRDGIHWHLSFQTLLNDILL